MTVYAVYEGNAERLNEWSDYLTAGKRYEASDIDEYGFALTDDVSDRLYCLWSRCNHLPPHNEDDKRNWTRVED